MRHLLLTCVALSIVTLAACTRVPSLPPAAPPVPNPDAVPAMVTASIKPLHAPPADVSAVAFVGGGRGWVARGTALLTTGDGGGTWEALAALDGPIHQLDFISAEQGWAVTTVGLYVTRDRGGSWQKVALRSAGDKDRVDFVDADHGWVLTGSELQATADGGRSWAAVTNPCDATFDPGHFSFISPEGGYVVCGGQPGTGQQPKRLFRTRDGGRHWELTAAADGGGGVGVLPMSGYVAELYFVDAGHGWLSLARGGLYATADGGSTWKLLATPGGGDMPLLDLRFVSPQQGFARLLGNGRSAVLQSPDGGATWTPVYPADEPAFHAPMAVLGPRSALEAGSATSRVALLRTDDGGQTWRHIGRLPGETVIDLSFPDAQHGWAVTERWEDSRPVRELWRSTDGGVTWAAQPFPFDDPKDALASVSFVDAQTGFAGSGWGHLFTSHDGGGTWQRVDAADSKSSGYRFVSAAEGWKADDLKPYLTADGGKSWTPVALAYRVWQISPLAGGRAWVLAGECGAGPCQPVLLYTPDAGRHWTRFDLGPLKPSLVRFGDADHGWLTDEADHLYTTADAGRTWVQVR